MTNEEKADRLMSIVLRRIKLHVGHVADIAVMKDRLKEELIHALDAIDEEALPS